MKNTLAAICIFIVGAIAGCEIKKSNTGVDGYFFEQETFTRTEFPIEVILVKSDAEMAALITSARNVSGKVEAANVAAFSTIRNNDTRCTIYMIDPKVRYEPQWYGHELTHCIYGVWHHEPQR